MSGVGQCDGPGNANLLHWHSTAILMDRQHSREEDDSRGNMSIKRASEEAGKDGMAKLKYTSV